MSCGGRSQHRAPGSWCRGPWEAWEVGATEVCIQAGLAPKLDGWFYVDLVRTLKKELPELHLHAFSPEEVLSNAQTYTDQLFRVLDSHGVEVRWQSEWFDKFRLGKTIPHFLNWLVKKPCFFDFVLHIE